MSSQLTRADVERIAELAHLELSEEEQETFARQLAEILAYAEAVQAVDTTDVPPTTHLLSSHDALRADEVRDSLSRDDALANAPDAAADEGFFKVPKVIG
ncbi:MAG: Asp-tRNA(Asn)/Glu-tRNA(Gln) amidotransferase subunit GatC [Vicinamibacterales bacterium]|jgi:aspartyl-tRNA(Asn)/glutamyl-tRNA(Gln) amidotransferase subunit C|nr:Asp-tRNA(Asn)/Glu-tRNA(Gln) amidotransferase GatCAB subunit C [Acidobacteriota bacterium]MDP6370959.1 Asp-tRNA(Asn)/Glu-tRNA(Gln) amidotransferase subunit GatC [Vicinamibacterales bacterium]MDP6607473.1 Asp-tRNA(Asn)/Glu-tRNA(Gln) amidotransferase subunit GatC [Vicinamibacterales bacterium]HAK55387.1 Asp-tRNA(Asn)/Glu-tRNA(Gln) amidotransferase subunit GatB [Acidobacteriota bacterium]|tara:strand:+ start:2430 stop:2729 length:300 start_codon:yes stop_codon:yes gene_type:complete